MSISPNPNAPIFLIGRFRSGTTMFWNFFRQFPDFTCYCEPFHEILLHYLDHPAPVSDTTHRGVKDYYAEYRTLDIAKIKELWKPWFANSRFWLRGEEFAPDMEQYLRYLIANAPKRPVFKIVRGDFRGDWIRNRFPDATIIHMVRNPRDLWTSSVGRNSALDDSTLEIHPKYGAFRYYLDLMCKDLGLEVPGHPYRLFYLFWRLSRLCLERVANAQWWYEDAVHEFPAWAEKNLIQPGLLPAVPPVQLHEEAIQAQFHPPHWYQIQEEFVNDLLQHPHACDLAHFAIGGSDAVGNPG